MPRRHQAERRTIAPDPKYGNEEVARFINKVMVCGKKPLAQAIVYQAFQKLEEETKRSPLEVFEQAMRNVAPVLEVKPRRVGGATYQVPVEVRGERRTALGMRWIIVAARARTGAPIVTRLYQELLDASRGQGAAAKRREDLHRMAEANRAFAHYRW